MSKLFNCASLPAGLRSVQNENWSVKGALAELVDNSFGPGRGDATEVIISYDSKKRILTITDNGKGMDAIGRLFQHGNTIGRAIGDIGEYGAGGTKALLWLAAKARVCALRNGKVQSDSVVWKHWFYAPSFEHCNVSNEWYSATLRNTPAQLLAFKHGTYIELHLLHTRRFQSSHVVRDLSKLFSTGLRRGKKITWRAVNEGKLVEETQLQDPFASIPSSAEMVGFDLVLEYEDQHLPVSGRVQYHPDTPHSESRVHIGYVYRVIRSVTECFQSASGDERYVGTGVSGWLDLGEGWQPYLTTTKDSIDDIPLFETLMQHVFEKIKPLLKKAEHRSIDIIFEDLALGLEQAINAKGGDTIVEASQIENGHAPGFGDAPDIDPPQPGPLPDLAPNFPGDEEGNIPKNVPPLLRLIAVPTSDTQMEQTLCRSTINGDDIIILVNRDHEVVQEAMKSKPINRMALNLLIVGELSEAIAADPASERLIKRLFRPSVASIVTNRDDRREKARAMGRLLIDRVQKNGGVPIQS